MKKNKVEQSGKWKTVFVILPTPLGPTPGYSEEDTREWVWFSFVQRKQVGVLSMYRHNPNGASTQWTEPDYEYRAVERNVKADAFRSSVFKATH